MEQRKFKQVLTSCEKLFKVIEQKLLKYQVISASSVVLNIDNIINKFKTMYNDDVISDSQFNEFIDIFSANLKRVKALCIKESIFNTNINSNIDKLIDICIKV